MSYELGFSQDFFLAEGEPNDRVDLALNEQGNPISVWSAICKMDQRDWESLALEVFGRESKFLTPKIVLEKIRETNTCSNLSVPVQVWIDKQGYHTVKVWE